MISWLRVRRIISASSLCLENAATWRKDRASSSIPSQLIDRADSVMMISGSCRHRCQDSLSLSLSLSLALKAHAGYVIALALLQTYLGGDAGRRVHAGAIERGSVERIRAVLWYADIRGFTAIADATRELLIDLLDQVFEVVTQSLRQRGAQVLKFLGDGMLATFPVHDANCADTCRMALDAAGGKQCVRSLL